MQPGKKATCSKICSFGNCKSDGRTLPPDSGVTFIPFAKPCKEFRDEAVDLILKNNTSANRRHDTGKCEKCSRALRWISLCRRQDNRLRTLIDVSRSMFVCSKHFVGNAPKETNEDPMPANILPSQMATLRRIGKRKPPVDRSTVTAAAPKKQRPRTTCGSIRERENADVGQPKPVVIAAARSSPRSGLPSAAPTAEVEESDRTTLPAPCNAMQESARPSATNAPAVPTDETVAARLPMVVVVPAPTIVQTCPLFVISQQPQPSDIKALAQERMMSGWACMINERFACFIRYDVETHESFLEVRVFYCEAPLRCETFVFGEALADRSDLATEQRNVVNFHLLRGFMCRLDRMNVCKGIAKCELVQEFRKIETPRGGKFCGRSNSVRSTKCKSFCCGTKCLECVRYAHSLGALARRCRSRNGKVHENCNNRFLSREYAWQPSSQWPRGAKDQRRRC